MLALIATLTLLPHAHAHNDYAHPRPLLDALDQGFLSVEADIFLVDGELRVGHTRNELRPGRTLESLYLDPLKARVEANKGTVYGQPGTLTILVDLKEDGKILQPVLLEHLAKYRSMLSEREGTTVLTRAVQIVLSGARTEDCAAEDGVLFKDGTLKNVEEEASRTPWISDSYPSALGARESPLPAEGRQKLADLLKRVHASGKRMRLWEAPDKVETWKELSDSGMDLVNTDRLADLRAFFLTAR